MHETNSRILIVNPFGIGDVLFTLPLIAELRRAYPDVFIGFLCNSRSAAILRHVPAIQQVFIYDRDVFQAAWKRAPWAGLKIYWKLLSELRRSRFETVFDLSLVREFGFLLWGAGIKKRVGYNYKKRGAFLTLPLPLPDGYAHQHVAAYHLDVLRAVEPAHVFSDTYPVMILVPSSMTKAARSSMASVPGRIRIGIAPGGGKSWGKESPRKHWGADRFASLANRLCLETDCAITLFGSDDEKDIIDTVYNQIGSTGRVVNAAGSLSLEEFMAHLSLCDILIANDGGPLHMAVALGIKTVSLFGPTSATVYGPFCGKDKKWMHRVLIAKLPCQPCYGNFRMHECGRGYECLRSISVEEVYGEVIELLKKKK